MERFQNLIKAGLKVIIHVKAIEQFSEPNWVVVKVILDFFRDQTIQKRDTKSPYVRLPE